MMINKGIIENNKKKTSLRNKFRTVHAEYKKQLKIAMYNKDVNAAFKICQALDKLPKNSSLTRMRNRCSITGRARGLVCYKVFPICGVKLREHANQGHIPGVHKI